MREKTTIAEIKPLNTDDGFLVDCDERFQEAIEMINHLKNVLRDNNYRCSDELQTHLTNALNLVFHSWVLFRKEAHAGKLTNISTIKADFAGKEPPAA